MKQRLAWNRGKPYVQSYQPISALCHTLLAMETPLFPVKRCFSSLLFLNTSVKEVVRQSQIA